MGDPYTPPDSYVPGFAPHVSESPAEAVSPSEHPKLDIHKPLPGVIRAQQRAKAKADALAAASPVPRQRASSGERKQQEAEIVARREQVTLSCSAPIHSAVMSTAKEDSIGAMVKDNEEPFILENPMIPQSTR